MEIIEYGNKVSEDLFKIPNGYTKMEYESRTDMFW